MRECEPKLFEQHPENPGMPTDTAATYSLRRVKSEQQEGGWR